MKQKNKFDARRTFLKTGLILTGAIAAGVILDKTIRPNTQAISRILTRYLDYPDLARELGKSIIKNEPGLAKLSIEQMTELALQDAGLSKGNLIYSSLLTNMEFYRKTVRNDFDTENIVHVNGWVISRTEAHLCALLYLYDNTCSNDA